MKATTPTARFHVQEHGNGWAYTITDQETGDNFFVQDEAADTLEKDSEDFCNEDVLATYMDALGEQA